MKASVGLALAVAMGAGSALACSVVIVGKDASATGRVLVGHNEDDAGELFVRNGMVPARDFPDGATMPAERGCAAIPQVPHAFGFFWTEVKHFKGGVSNADSFFNENGVLVVSDNAAPVPFEDGETKLTDGGIYYNLRRAIAERARSARDAVDVATNLLTRWGYAAPGRIYTVADKDEAWTIQALKGRRFVARRCPDDAVVAVPNCLTIRRLEPGDVVAPCVAAEAAKDPEFDYARRFQGEKRWRQPSDTLRWKHLYRIAAGVDVGGDYPYSVKPAHRVSPDDIRAALSTHYENTPDQTKHYKHGVDKESAYLAVCRPSTIESIVCVFAARAADTELLLAPGSPCENAYRPFRPFADGIPAELDRSADAVERLENHCRPMTWAEYLAQMERPTARDGVGRFRFADIPEGVYYDAPHALEKGSACEIAVVLVHGWGGGLIRADEQAPMMRALKAATRSGAEAPYVIAPLYPRQDLVERNWTRIDGLATWNASWNTKDLAVRGKGDDDWRGGGDAVGTTLSSYDVIDRIFATFADRKLFPNLKRVVLTGFSAGGQFAGRYAAVGKGVVRDGVEVAYAAMAPSTEFRFLPDVKWHYGLKDRPRYSAALSESEIMRNLTSRRVWRGCGRLDVLGRPHTSLDSCAEAMAQGTNRYDRFCNFQSYLKAYPDWAKRVSFHTFEHIGHRTEIAHCDPAFIAFVVNDGPSASEIRKDLEKGFLPGGAAESSWASVYQQVDELDARADREWLRLRSREEYDAHRKALHAKMIEAIGGFPERTPLNARTVSTIRREGYVIEKVMFESMPGLIVSANLFIPDRPEFKPPYAAVVMSCGHAQQDGKDSATYQRACVHVANRGMVAFMFDPYEQGERCQYCGKGGNCCQQHNLIGLKAMLLGWSMPMLRLWDGIRAVDYVETRAEVDKDRIGYMGQSGGGTMSALMTAADWRLKATAPSCYLTSLGYLCKFMGPQDAEQNIFGQLKFGLNHTGYVLLPDTKVCVTGRFSDMFPWGGAAQLSRTVGDVAAMLGETGNYGLNFAPGPHGWTESTMAASADWMAAWLKGEKSLLPLDMPKYRAMDLGYSTKTVDCGIPFGESRVTPEYRTTRVEGSRDIHAILRDRFAAFRAKRVRRTADETAALVKRLAVIREPSAAKIAVKTVETSEANGLKVSRIAFMYPDGLALPAVLFEGERADPAKPPVLMVGTKGRGAFASEVGACLARGEWVLVADVTGAGDINGLGKNGSVPHVFYGCEDTPEEGTAVMLYLMGESMVGRRASDILLLADWLKRTSGTAPRVCAKGSVSIAAAHAFAADRSLVAGVEVSDTPPSWSEIIETPGAPISNRYAWCVNGALIHYDWTDLLIDGKD